MGKSVRGEKSVWDEFDEKFGVKKKAPPAAGSKPGTTPTSRSSSSSPSPSQSQGGSGNVWNDFDAEFGVGPAQPAAPKTPEETLQAETAQEETATVEPPAKKKHFNPYITERADAAYNAAANANGLDPLANAGITKVTSDKLKSDAIAGNEIEPSQVEFVKQTDPATYDKIAKAFLPTSKHEYKYSKEGVKELSDVLTTNNQYKEAQPVFARFKAETGEDYSPEAAAKLTPRKRIELQVPQADDVRLATDETIKEDFDNNFPVKEPGFYESYLPNVKQQEFIRQGILTNPQEKNKYLLSRLAGEMESKRSTENDINNLRLSLAGLGTNAFGQDQQSVQRTQNLRPGMEEKLGKLNEDSNALSEKISGIKNLAATAIRPVIIERYLTQLGIDTKTPEGKERAVKILATKESRQYIGMEITKSSDLEFVGNLSDISASTMDDMNKRQLAGRIFKGLPIVDNDTRSQFQSLSTKGMGKKQAQISVFGHDEIKKYFADKADYATVAKLKEEDQNVVIENGAAISDELWVRISSARFKENGNKTTIGNYGTSADDIRRYAEASNFSPTHMAILPSMIEDEESRSFTSNIQSGGFTNKFIEAVGTTALSLKNINRSDAERVRENLNDNAGRLENIGEYSPFVQELEQLAKKEKQGPLSPQQINRKQLLEENTHLLSHYQKLSGGSGGVSGQVASQIFLAMVTQGVGSAVLRGARATMAALEVGAGAVSTGLMGGVSTSAIVAAEVEAAAAGVAAARAALTGTGAAVAETGVAGGVAATTRAVSGLDAAGAAIGESAFASGPSALSKAAAYVKDKAPLYFTAYSISYDNNAKEALQLMPGSENAGRRLAYTNMMSVFEGLSEGIFDQRKAFNALRKQISPAVGKIVTDMSSGSLTKAAAMGQLTTLLGGSFKKFGVNTFVNTNKEAFEEWTVSAGGDIAKAMVLNRDYDFAQSMETAYKTYYTMAIDGLLVAGMAARGDTRNNTLNKSTLYHVAARPQDYKDEINRLLLTGKISNQQANDKQLVVSTAVSAYRNMVRDKVVDQTGKNDAANATYLLHTVNEAISLENAERATDSVVKDTLKKDAERSRKIREGIYTGKIHVDQWLEANTRNAQEAAALDINYDRANGVTQGTNQQGTAQADDDVNIYGDERKERKNADSFTAAITNEDGSIVPEYHTYKPRNKFLIPKDNFGNVQKDAENGDTITVEGRDKKTNTSYAVTGVYNDGVITTPEGETHTMDDLKETYKSDRPTIHLFPNQNNSSPNTNQDGNKKEDGTNQTGSTGETSGNQTGTANESTSTGTVTESSTGTTTATATGTGNATNATGRSAGEGDQTNQNDETGDGGILDVNGAAPQAAPLQDVASTTAALKELEKGADKNILMPLLRMVFPRDVGEYNASVISAAYHKAVAEGNKPEFVSAVEKALGKVTQPASQTNETTRKEIHDLAKQKGFSNADLMNKSAELTGERHLDNMNEAQLKKVKHFLTRQKTIVKPSRQTTKEKKAAEENNKEIEAQVEQKLVQADQETDPEKKALLLQEAHALAKEAGLPIAKDIEEVLNDHLKKEGLPADTGIGSDKSEEQQDEKNNEEKPAEDLTGNHYTNNISKRIYVVKSENAGVLTLADAESGKILRVKRTDLEKNFTPFDWEGVFDELTPEEQEEVDKKFAEDEDAEKEKAYQASGFSKKWAATREIAIAKTIKKYRDAAAVVKDWSAREYKPNPGSVEIGGKNEDFGDRVSINSINENRRKRTIAHNRSEMQEALDSLRLLGLTQAEIDAITINEKKIEDGKIASAEQELTDQAKQGELIEVIEVEGKNAEAEGEDAGNSEQAEEVIDLATGIITVVDGIIDLTPEQAARKAGEKVVDGTVVKRQGKIAAMIGKAVNILFAKKDSEQGHYAIVENDDLQASHYSGVPNEKHFIPEAQPRDRGALAVLVNAAKEKSDNLQVDQLGDNNTAYYGAPVINERGEVIQGNGRQEAIDYYYRNDTTDSKGYRQMLLDKAVELGLDVNAIKAMKNPVLVKITQANDERAILLGNYVASDLEDVKQTGSDTRAAFGKMTPANITELLALIKTETNEDSTLLAAVRSNIKNILNKLIEVGAIRADKREVIFPNGQITSSGLEQVTDIIKQLLFNGGESTLSKKFDNLSAAQRTALEKTIPAILSNKELTKRVQQVIAIINDFRNSGIAEFDTWQKSRDMFGDQKAPLEKNDAATLKLAQEIVQATTQKVIAERVIEIAKMMKGEPANMFDAAMPAQTFEQVMGIDKVIQQTSKTPKPAPPKTPPPAPPEDIDNKPEAPAKTLKMKGVLYNYKATDSLGNHLYTLDKSNGSPYPYLVVEKNSKSLINDLVDHGEFPEFFKYNQGRGGEQNDTPPPPSPPPAPPPPITPGQKRAARRMVTNEKDRQDIIDALRELQKPTGLLGMNMLTNPVKLERSVKVIGMFMKMGVHKFSHIIEDAYSMLGEEIADLFDSLKTAYGAYYFNGATKEERSGMDMNEADLTFREITFDFTSGLNLELDTPNHEKIEKAEPQRQFIDSVKEKILNKEKQGIISLRKLAVELGIDVKDTHLQELAEMAIVELSREVAQSKELDSAKLAAIIEIYNNQPTIGMRSADRIALQQYSTPAPIAFLSGLFVQAGNPQSIFEPSAGNGVMTINFPAHIVTVNEIDAVRLTNLGTQHFGALMSQDAMQPFYIGQKDGIVMNPPFGSSPEIMVDGFKISGLDEKMIVNALNHLSPNGRAAIIMGGHNEFDDKGRLTKERTFFNYLYNHYHVAGVLNISGQLYQKQGTTFPIRLILINGVKSTPEGVAPLSTQNDVVNSFDDLYRIINNLKETDNGAQDFLQSGLDGNTGKGGNIYGNGSGGIQGNNQGRLPALPPGQVLPISPAISPATPNTGTSGGGRAGNRSKPNQPDSKGTGKNDNADGQLPDLGADIPPIGDNGANGINVDNTGGNGIISTNNPPLAPRQFGNNELSENAKVLYRPKSKGFSLQTVIPSQMAADAERILTDIDNEFGGIDNYVMQKLNYSSVAEMHKGLAAEQVDAIAMAIRQIEAGQGMIIGDMTGVGKGRIAAGIVRYAINRGIKPIFVSENAGLFSDLYRDMVNIGSGELVPFVINNKSPDNDANITDEEGAIIYKVMSPAQKIPIFKSLVIPANVNYVMASYSQFRNSPTIPNAKTDYFRAIANNNILILDESHNAGGLSNTGLVFQDVLANAMGVTFLSATFAKRPDNMPVYALRTAMSEANMTSDELIGAVVAGGVALQEVVSAQLVESGQMLRRERSFEGVKIDYETLDEFGAEHMATADAVTEVIRDVIAFEKEYVAEMLAARDDELSGGQGSAGRRKGVSMAGVDNTPFSSKVFNVIDQLLFAIKAAVVADKAIAEAKAGRKPVIGFKSTMGSFLNHLNAKAGDKLDNIDFSLTLKRSLEGTMRYSESDAKGQTTKKTFLLSDLSAEGREAYAAIMVKINKASLGITVSPIDTMIKRIQDAGFTVAEVTGRKLMLNIQADGTAIVENRTNTDKKKIVRDFNDGSLDIIMINAAGATGISLHASENFKDQRERVMIDGQMELDINKLVQKRGRIDRTGQVRRGRFRYITSAIPAEKRLQMMAKKKLKSLDANTTSSQQSKESDADTVDFLNKYGDEVVTEYLKDERELNDKLLDPLSLNGMNETDLDSLISIDGAASRVTGRVALLSSKDQLAFYKDVGARYADFIEYLESNNSNTLEVKTMDLKAVTISSQVIIAGKGGESSFGKDSVLETIEVDVLKKPLTKAEIDAHIKESLGEKTADEKSKELADGVVEYYEKYVAGLIEEIEKQHVYNREITAAKAAAKAIEEGSTDVEGDVEGALERLDFTKNENVKRLEKRFGFIETNIARMAKYFKAGKIYDVPTSVKPGAVIGSSNGVFLGFEVKKDKKNPYAPSAIKMRFAVNDSRRIIVVPLSKQEFINTIIANSSFLVQQAKDNIRENWDNLQSKSLRAQRYMVTGNLLQAFSTNDGQLISYTDSRGDLKNGLLLPENYDPSQQKLRLPIAQAAKYLQKRDDKISSIDNEVVIVHRGEYLTISVPLAKRTGGVYFLDNGLRDLISDRGFNQSNGRMEAAFSSNKLPDILKLLGDKFKLSIEVKPEKTQGSGNKNAQFSSKDEASEFQTNDKTPVTVEALAAKYPGAIVVQNQTDLPQEIQDQAKEQGVKQIEGVLHKGKVYLVAANLTSMGRAEGVYRHETIGHKGVIAVLKKGLNGYATNLVDSATGIQKSALEKLSQRLYGKAISELGPIQKSILGQEYIAMVAENPQKYPTTFQQVAAFVRGVLRDMGIRVAVSDNDIKVLLARASKRVNRNTGVSNATALFSIVGEKANLDSNVRDNLVVARDMEAAGKSIDEIYRATGWQKGADEKWRNEVPDIKLNTKNITENGDMVLSDIIKPKSELVTAYPELANTQIIFAPNTDYDGAYSYSDMEYNEQKGVYDRNVHTIVLSTRLLDNPAKMKSVLIHELQHTIQQIEGFARGGNPQLAQTLVKSSALKLNEFEAYQSLAGETEARNAQTRAGMTDAQRSNTPFSASEDVAREDQIKYFGDSVQQSKAKNNQIELNFDAQPTRHEAEIPDEKGEKQKVQFETTSTNGDYTANTGVQPAGEISGGQTDDRNIRTVAEVWSEDKNIQFTGTTKVKNAADVAHIMRLLENSAVEHAFAVHIDKKGNSHIQYISIGSITGAIVDPKLVLAGVKKFGSVKTYLVHNHPSGLMRPSEADKNLTIRIAHILRYLKIPVEHIIMDTLTQEYILMDDYGETELKSRKADELLKPSLKDQPLITHAFRGQAALREPLGVIKGGSDVARVVYGLRFSALPKFGMLIMNHANAVIGNYVFQDGLKINEILNNFSGNATATRIILYGNTPIDDPTLLTVMNDLVKNLRAADIQLLDYVNIKGGGKNIQQAYEYESSADEGLMLREIEEQYGTNKLTDLLKKIRDQRTGKATEAPPVEEIIPDEEIVNKPVEDYADQMIAYVKSINENATSADVIAELEPQNDEEAAALAAYIKTQFGDKETPPQQPPPPPQQPPTPDQEQGDDDFIVNYTLPLIERGSTNDSLKTDLAAGYTNDVLEQDDMVDSMILNNAVASLNDFIQQAKARFGDYVLDYSVGLYNAFKNRKDDTTKLGVMVMLKNNLDNERQEIDDIIQGLKSVNPDNAEITLLMDERNQIVQQLRIVANYIDQQGAVASKKMNILRLTKKLRGLGRSPQSFTTLVGPDIDGQSKEMEADLDAPIDNDAADMPNDETAEDITFEAPVTAKRKAASSDLTEKAKASVKRMKSAKGKLADLAKQFNKFIDQASKLC